MKISLRPHHFLCLKGYKGYTYSKTQTGRMEAISKMLKEHPDTDVLILGGKDDLCLKCPAEIDKEHSSCNAETVRNLDKQVLSLLGISVGQVYKFRQISLKLNNVMNKDIHQKLCSMCAWWKKGLCRNSFEKG